MKTLRLACQLLLCLFSISLFSQSEMTIRLEKVQGNDGLPGRYINVIYQDSMGLMWFGTKRGLVKYDGYRMELFQYVPENFIQGSQPLNISIISIAEDKHGNFWIGVEHSEDAPSLLFFERKTQKIIPYWPFKNRGKNQSKTVLRVLVDQYDQVWLGTGHGLYRFQAQAKETQRELDLIHLNRENSGIPYPYVNEIFTDNQGSVWAITGGGFSVWDPRKQRFDTFEYPDKEPSPLDYNYIAQRDDGKIWVITWGKKLRLFDPLARNFEFELDLSRVRVSNKMVVDQKGGIWFGHQMALGGLFRYEPSRKILHQAKMSSADFNPIGSQFVTSIFEDKDGILWIGKRPDGLYKYDPEKNKFGWAQFTTDESKVQSLSITNDILGTKDDKMWANVIGHGIVEWNKKENSFTRISLPVEVRKWRTLLDIEIDHLGKIWYGGFIEGIGWYDPISGQKRFYSERIDQFTLLFGGIFSIYEDRKKQLWVTGWKGLFKYDSNSDSFKSYEIPSSFFKGTIINLALDGILEDKEEYLWLGGFVRDFYRYNPNTNEIKSFRAGTGPKSFYEDSKGDIWVGTLNSGLVHINKTTLEPTYFGTEDGLPDVAIRCILEDDHQRLWLGTGNGLSCYDPQKETFRNYSFEDGISNTELIGRGFKNHKGEMFFTGSKGITWFHPDSLELNERPPEPILTQIDLFDQPIQWGEDSALAVHPSVAQELNLPYNKNSLTFHYSALHFKNPTKNSYKVRLLSPKDTAWRDMGTTHSVSYTNIDPGSYTFQVIAANSDGIWNETPLSFPVSISPPWFWAWWSKILYVLLLTGTIVGIYRFQLKRRLATAEAKRLRELDQVKNRLYTNITHEFRTPLTVIQGVSDNIDGHLKEKELLQRNSQQLLNLVNQVLDLSKLETGKLQLNLVHGDILHFLRYVIESFHSLANHKNIRLEFHNETPADVLEMDYDPEKVLQIISNLVSNAIKFTPTEGKIQVSALQSRNGVLVIEVSDTGIGIPTEQIPHIFDRFYQVDTSSTRTAEGTGIGLALTKELVELMEGKISVKSKEGEGTDFRIEIPITHTSKGEIPEHGFQEHREIPESITHINKQVPAGILETLPVIGKSSEKPLLLIVEDNPDVVHFLTSCLQEDYLLAYASNGKKGIEEALHRIPDIIISDVMMPEIDGFELCKTLKQDERTSHIPIILLTAKADMEAKLEGLEFGADAYLTKPFHKKELAIRLSKLIELRRRLQRKYRNIDFISETTTIREDTFIAKVRQLVIKHMEDEDFGIEPLCEMVHMSRQHLHRKLKALTGFSASHFIRKIRLHEAHKLLTQTDMNVSEATFAVGFSDVSYFSKLFSKEFGYPPSKAPKPR